MTEKSLLALIYANRADIAHMILVREIAKRREARRKK